MRGRLFGTVLLVGLVTVFLLSLGVSIWNFNGRHLMREAVDDIDMRIHSEDSQQRLFSVIQTLTSWSFPINSTALKLSKVIESSAKEDLSSVSAIEEQAGDKLFCAFSILQNVSQISYIGERGFLFSYYTEGNQTFALFTNASFASSSSPSSPWYSQPVDGSGSRHVHNNRYAPTNLVNPTVFHDALYSELGYACLGREWGRGRGPVFLAMAPVKSAVPQGQRGVVSLAVPLQAVTSFISSISLDAAFLYLVTKDGVSLSGGGIPNTKLVLNNQTVLIQQTQFANNSIVGESAFTISCNIDHGNVGQLPRTSHVKIQGVTFVTHCTSLDILGTQTVSVLAFAQDPHLGVVLKQSEITSVVLSLLPVGLLVLVVFFVFFLCGNCRKEVLWRDMLIKQNEATLQAERKSMNKSQAFASASHDIRTSLGAIVGLIEISNSRVLGDSELETNLSQMKSCAHSLLGILNEVLDSSKVEAGKMQLNEDEFDMAKLLEEVTDNFSVIGEQKGIEVLWDPCDSSIMKLPPVIGDCKKCMQILSNLIGNAVKFTTEGHVVLRAWARKPSSETMHMGSNDMDRVLKRFGCLPHLAQKEKGVDRDAASVQNVRESPNCIEIVFEVDDTGKGIPKEKQSSVFENYVQVKGTQEGTGLGLGIVQSMVRLMGGEIAIVNKDPGDKGTCFHLNIFLTKSENQHHTWLSERNGDPHPHPPPSPLSIKSIASSRSPRQQGIHAVLLIKGEEARRICHKWLVDQGIKVWSLGRIHLLKQTLYNLKKRLALTQNASSSSPRSDSSSIVSATQDLDEALSGKYDMDHSLSLVGRENRGMTSSSQPSNLSLIIILDMSFEPFSEISTILNNFSRDVPESAYRVVWLSNKDTSKGQLDSLRSRHFSCSSIIRKPFHGSRLVSVLRLLDERSESCMVEVGPSSSGAEGNDDDEEKAETVKTPLNGLKFLVVEDNMLMLKITKTALDLMGASVESANNGKVAVDMVRQALSEVGREGSSSGFKYDVILMDCEMPIMDGFAATKLIRKEEEWYGRHIPIIALTAHVASEEIIQRYVDAGMDGHLLKPLIHNKFLKETLPLINHLLDRPNV